MALEDLSAMYAMCRTTSFLGETHYIVSEGHHDPCETKYVMKNIGYCYMYINICISCSVVLRHVKIDTNVKSTLEHIISAIVRELCIDWACTHFDLQEAIVVFKGSHIVVVRTWGSTGPVVNVPFQERLGDKSIPGCDLVLHLGGDFAPGRTVIRPIAVNLNQRRRTLFVEIVFLWMGMLPHS